LRERKPQTYRFKDDGLIPNHPKWPLITYKSAVIRIAALGLMKCWRQFIALFLARPQLSILNREVLGTNR
jgi:hypothetical protein